MKTIIKKVFLIQHSIEKIEKNANNPFYNSRYADLSTIQEVLKPLLFEHQLIVVHAVENNHLVTNLICLDSEEKLTSSIDIANLNDPQKVGSQLTYYRRYNLVNLFDLKVEDDDANKTVAKPVNNNPVQNTPAPEKWLNLKTKDGQKTQEYLALEKAISEGKNYTISAIRKEYKVSKESQQILENELNIK